MHIRAAVTLVAVSVGTVLVQPGMASAISARDVAGCTVRALPAPAQFVSTSVRAGDASGRWLVGWGETAEHSQSLLRWHDRRPEVMSVDHMGVEINAIASDGTIAGAVSGPEGYPEAFLIDPAGNYRTLGTFPGALSARATGANAGGTISGEIVRADYSMKVVVWRPDSYDEPEVFRLPVDEEVQTVGMSEHGTVAANLPFGGRSFIWSKEGRRTELTRPPDFSVWVQAVSRGWAAGWGLDGSENPTLRWRLSDGALTVIPSNPLAVTSVNRHGLIGGSDYHSGRAVLVKGGEVRELPHFGSATWSTVQAVASNGRAAGTSGESGGTSTAVMWRCPWA